jgi:hypothetical protein
MVIRRWSGSVAVAAGVAAAAGAAQLGMAYGTGVIFWPVAPGEPADHAWVTSLTWATWIATSSTIAGAVVASRLRTLASGPGAAADGTAGVLWHLVLVVAAAVGAMITVLLITIPARDAVTTVTASPPATAAAYAMLGVLVGLLLATGALAARAVAANLIATAAWLWSLAVVVVAEGVVAGRELPRIPLGFWGPGAEQFAFRNILFPDAAIALGAALAIGALAALPAVRRGDPPVGVVASGAAGPLALAVAYLLAQPDLAGAAAADLSRYLVAPYLVLAGLAGSLLAGAVRTRAARPGPPAGAGNGQPRIPSARRAAGQPATVD